MSLLQDAKNHQQELEFIGGFMPIVGQALSIRDITKALANDDYEAAAIAATDLLPIGRIGKAIGKYDYIGRASDALTDRAMKLYHKLIGKGHGSDAAADLVYRKTNVDVHAERDRNKEVEIQRSKEAPSGDVPSPASDYIRLGKGAEAHDVSKLKELSVLTDPFIPSHGELNRDIGGGLISVQPDRWNKKLLNHELSHTQVRGGTSINPKYRKADEMAYREVEKAQKTGSLFLIKRALENRVNTLKALDRHERKYYYDKGEITSRASELDHRVRPSVREKQVRNTGIESLDEIGARLNEAVQSLAEHLWRN